MHCYVLYGALYISSHKKAFANLWTIDINFYILLKYINKLCCWNRSVNFTVICKLLDLAGYHCINVIYKNKIKVSVQGQSLGAHPIKSPVNLKICDSIQPVACDHTTIHQSMLLHCHLYHETQFCAEVFYEAPYQRLAKVSINHIQRLAFIICFSNIFQE